MPSPFHKTAVATIFTSLLLLTQTVCAAQEQLPVSFFANLPQITDAQLSPSGKHLAFFVNDKGSSLLIVRELDSGESVGISKTDNFKFVFKWLRWVNDDRLVFSTSFPNRRVGVATSETRLLSAARDASDTKVLGKPRNRFGKQEHHSQFSDQVVSFLPDDPEHILLALDTSRVALPQVWRVNVESGKRRKVQRDKSPIRQWFADQQGKVRAGRGYDDTTTTYSAIVRRPDSDKWIPLWKYEPFKQPDIQLLGFGLDPSVLYVRANHQGRQAIFKLDTASPTFERELVLTDPDYDISGDLVYSPANGDVIGVRHFRSAGSILYLDKEAQALQNSVDKVLPDTHNQIVGLSRDEMRYLVLASSDNQPGRYFFGDRDKATLRLFGHQYTELADADLSHKSLVRYKARDDLEIEGFLSLPVDSHGLDLPTIIFPHGGPMARDYGGFDYWTQFFTSRGYAVLQPNFRGSAGYGAEFMMAAVGSFGLAMQDDLEDGALWLVDRGISDPKRICIAGASYGGYAALVGVIKTPDLYRCAISFAGVSSLLDLRAEKRYYVSKNLYRGQIGSDKEQLKTSSPLYNAEKIKVPVLLAHGDKDRIVAVSHSQKMAKALSKARKDVTYVELEMGSHYLHRQENRTAFFEAMDTFLAQHLPVE